MSLTEPNESTEVLTVDEAAVLLRVSRNSVYSAARQWRATGGKEGLPCIEIGRSVRIPQDALRLLLRGSPLPGAEDLDDLDPLV